VDGFDVLTSMFAEATIRSNDLETQYYYEEPVQLTKAEIVGWNQQQTAEAAAIAATATIQHATGESAELNFSIPKDADLKSIGSLAEAAANIAARMAEAADAEGKLEEVSKHWNATNDGANREKQDSTQDQDVAPAKEVEVISSNGHEIDATAKHGPKLDDGLPRPSDGGAIGKTGESLALNHDKEPTRPDAESAGVSEKLEQEVPLAVDLPPAHVYDSGNIDPQYAVKENEVTTPGAASKRSEGSQPHSTTASFKRKKKKELMMARSS
jgi:hypothetical protein